MSITEYSDRIFASVCKCYRLQAQDPALLNFNKVRAELVHLIDGQDVNIDKTVRQAMTYFVDDIFIFGSWPFRAQWRTQPLEPQLFSAGIGAANFYTILNGIMPLDGSRSRQRMDDQTREILQVFYKCLGFGFLGQYRTNPANADAVRETVAANIGVSDEPKRELNSPLLESAYEVDDGDYGGAPNRSIKWVVLALVVGLIASITAYLVTFASAKRELQEELDKITAAQLVRPSSWKGEEAHG